jgi:hypothetical protein
VSAHQYDVAHVAVEGATDFFMGRPADANPYDPVSAQEGYEAWIFGWLQGKQMLELRRDKEVARWLA